MNTVIKKKNIIKIRIMRYFSIILIAISFLLGGHMAVATTASYENPTEIFSTYLGGTGDEKHKTTMDLAEMNVAYDSLGNIIVAGRSGSTDYPTENALYTENAGGIDMVISKFSNDGQTLLFSTYFGGSQNDWATDVVVDSNDDIVIIGSSGSTDLPTVNPYQATNNGGSMGDLDIVILKIDGMTHEILFSTYFGGTGDDWGYAIDIDSENNIAITGSTYSKDLPLVEALQLTNRGGVSVYISKFASDGQSLLFSTLWGSTTNDWGVDLLFDSEDSIIIAGGTMGNFPTENALQDYFNGGMDAIVMKVDSSNTLVFATMIGSEEDDRPYGLAINQDDDIFVCGESDGRNFANTRSTVDSGTGKTEMWAFQLAADGQSMPFMGFYGGSEDDIAYGIETKGDSIYLVGVAQMSEDFPLKKSLHGFSAGTDMVLMVLSDTFKIVYSGCYGGNKTDTGRGLCLLPNNEILLLGVSSSADLPMSNAYLAEKPGIRDYDMVMVKMFLNPEERIVDPNPSISGNWEFVLGSFIITVPFLWTKRRKSIQN